MMSFIMPVFLQGSQGQECTARDSDAGQVQTQGSLCGYVESGTVALVNEITSIQALMEDKLAGTPFEVHFREICSAIKQHEP